MAKRKELTFSISAEEMVKAEALCVANTISKFGEYEEGKYQASDREHEFHGVLLVLSLHHFGTPPSLNQRDLLEKACYLTREFFTGDWWQQHRTDRALMLREPGNKDFTWFKAFHRGMLFAALNRDKSLLKVLGAWPSNWMQPEWKPYPYPEGIEQLYFALINECGFGKIGVDKKRIKDKRIEMLFDAVSSLDDTDMASVLNQSLALFRKTLSRNDLIPYEAIAIEETIIVLLWELCKGKSLTDSIEADLRPHILRLVE